MTSCGTPGAILSVLQGKVNELNLSQSNDEQLNKWLTYCAMMGGFNLMMRMGMRIGHRAVRHVWDGARVLSEGNAVVFGLGKARVASVIDRQ